MKRQKHPIEYLFEFTVETTWLFQIRVWTDAGNKYCKKNRDYQYNLIRQIIETIGRLKIKSTKEITKLLFDAPFVAAVQVQDEPRIYFIQYKNWP